MLSFARPAWFQSDETEAYILISAMGIIVHLIFNRFEPRDPTPVLGLLFVVPGALSTVLSFNRGVVAIATTFLIYLSVLSLSVILYRISPFHPLARYPGPTVNKISKFWAAWIVTRGNQHIYYENLHRIYGNVVRVGPNALSIIDPETIVPLYGSEGLPKGPQVEGYMMGIEPPNISFVRDPEVHSHRRKYWSRGLNSVALKGYDPIIEKRAKQLIGLLEESEGSEIDLSVMLRYFSYDFMNDMSFGGGSEMLRDGDVNGLLKLQDGAVVFAGFFGSVPWTASLLSRLPFVLKEVTKFHHHAMNVAETRIREGSSHKDLFYYLNDEGGVDKEPPPLAQVASDGTSAIINGSDTIATTLSNLFCCLLGNQQAYRRLQAEVDKFYPAGEDALSTQFHAGMPYLAACINETLRLFPVLPDGSQRGSLHGTGAKMIGSYYIPEGTAVTIPSHAMQRDPRNFSPRSSAFWPERWLVANNLEPAPSDFAHNAAAFIPFSYGPENCIGKNLALQEMKMLVCLILQRLDIRAADGYDPTRSDGDVLNFILIRRLRLPVVLSKR